ncbi:MAG: hypothetical protein ACT4N9_07570 [Paracoccaceae bacterium]
MAIFFPNSDGTPVDLTAETERLLQEAAEELIRTISAVRAGEMDQLPAAKTAVKGLKDAFQNVMDERNRVEKLRKQVAGSVGTGTLDLSAARDEIGRRLALLRAARRD